MWHDDNMWELLPIECGAIYAADKAYINLKQMWRIQLAGAFFVMRPKYNMRFEVTREFTDDRLTSFVCADYAVRFIGYQSKHSYPDELRIMKVNESESGERVSFLTFESFLYNSTTQILPIKMSKNKRYFTIYKFNEKFIAIVLSQKFFVSLLSQSCANVRRHKPSRTRK